MGLIRRFTRNISNMLIEWLNRVLYKIDSEEDNTNLEEIINYVSNTQ